MIYIGIDGDDIGGKIERYFLENDEACIYQLSNAVQKVLFEFSDELKTIGFNIIFCTGDSLLAKGEYITYDMLRNIRYSHELFTFSIGVSDTIQQVYMALKYAKTSGKNRIIWLINKEFKTII